MATAVLCERVIEYKYILPIRERERRRTHVRTKRNKEENHLNVLTLLKEN